MCSDCAKIRKDINSLHRAVKHTLTAVDEIGEEVAGMSRSMDGQNWHYMIDWANAALKEIEDDGLSGSAQKN